MSVLVIRPDGRAIGLYTEEIDLATLGETTIRRASHVEPDDAGLWWADLSPVGGPALGPFARHSQAIAAERDWLAEHMEALSLPSAGPIHP